MSTLTILYDEPTRVFVQADGSSWLRTGYCCRCGDCCQGGDPYGDPNLSACRLYASSGGLGICTDRQSSVYLNGCNDWPTKPIHLVTQPRCTYRFEPCRP